MRARRRERPPDIQPATGHCLIEGIDAVLPLLTPPTQPSTVTRQLVEDLRVALARTAARGDTCQVLEAADSVRLAANLLLAGGTDEARQALRRARADLADAPDAHHAAGSETERPEVHDSLG
jgi:hypothetical protein